MVLALRSDYVRTAVAMGVGGAYGSTLSENALLPVMTMVGDIGWVLSRVRSSSRRVRMAGCQPVRLDAM